MKLLAKDKINSLGPPITPATKDSNKFPTFWAQERFWLLDQLEAGNTAHKKSRIIRIQGYIDYDILRLTILEIFCRHKILRTRLKSSINSISLQIIEPDINFTIQIANSIHRLCSLAKIVFFYSK